MEDEKTLLICSAVVVMLGSDLYSKGSDGIVKNKRRRRRPRGKWCHNKPLQKGSGSELSRDLKFPEISGQYKNFTYMSSSCFEALLMKIGRDIEKMSTNMREPISVQDRLAVTLRYLATGDSYTSLQYLFGISKQAIGTIIPDVCSALIKVLNETIKLPKDPSQWLEISSIFQDVWNFPHCIGAIDGKHVVLRSPMKSSTQCAKSKSSIALFVLVDGNFNFLFADIGCQGRVSDDDIFNNTKLYQNIRNNSLGLPAPTELPGQQLKVPYFFVTDSDFALEEHIMKPYGGNEHQETYKRIFNYRLNKAHRVVENAFGIMSSVFRVLRKPILLEPKNAQLVVATILYLHNYLRQESSNEYTPHGVLDYVNNGQFVPGSWRKDTEMTSLYPIDRKTRRSAGEGEEIRDAVANYCIRGAVESQNECA